MIAVFLAQGFEETEALTTVDVLRRAELDVVTVGIGGRMITGSHGITVIADKGEAEIALDQLSGIVLPGGMPGTLNLETSPILQQVVSFAAEQHLPIAAICAAPSVLGHRGLLEGKKATCFPGFEEELIGATVVTDAPVVTDGNIITAKGMGVTIPFALALVEMLQGKEDADRLEGNLQCR